MIFKIFLAFCIGLGALYAAQQYWLRATITKVAQTPSSQLFTPSQAAPPIELDPDKSRLAINPPVIIDTRKYEVPLPPRFR